MVQYVSQHAMNNFSDSVMSKDLRLSVKISIILIFGTF